MQMAVLNCTITVGQQLCTLILGAFEGTVDVLDAVKYLYIISAVANALGGLGSLLLNVGVTDQEMTSIDSTVESWGSDCPSTD